jgi:fructose/tagatose bisphosphate aldolase
MCDPARIAAIKRATGKPLINTELRVAWRRGMEAALARRPGEVVPYKVLPDVVESIKQVVVSRLQLFNTARSAAGMRQNGSSFAEPNTAWSFSL